MKIQTNLSSVLGKMASLEDAVLNLYSFYEEVFSDLPEAKRLFHQMQKEEQSHKSQVLLQKRLVDKCRDRYEPVHVDLDAIDDWIVRMDEHLLGGVFELNDALDFAIALESSAVETCYRSALEDVNPEMARLTRLLASADREHLGRLQNMREQHEGRSSLCPEPSGA